MRDFEAIVDEVANVNHAVQEISDATDQGAQSVTDVVGMVEEVASVSEETAAESDTVADNAAEQTDATDEVADQMDELAEQTAALAGMLDDFTVPADAGTADQSVADDSPTAQPPAADDEPAAAVVDQPQPASDAEDEEGFRIRVASRSPSATVAGRTTGRRSRGRTASSGPASQKRWMSSGASTVVEVGQPEQSAVVEAVCECGDSEVAGFLVEHAEDDARHEQDGDRGGRRREATGERKDVYRCEHHRRQQDRRPGAGTAAQRALNDAAEQQLAGADEQELADHEEGMMPGFWAAVSPTEFGAVSTESAVSTMLMMNRPVNDAKNPPRT